MSYQVLARKWRPKTFSQLMGQEHVVTVLVNALEQKRLHHAYLFTGTRGVGKTTIARIFAKSLNCETGITSSPCGICETCLDIDQGRFVDLLEIDAASRTKVDDTREILDNVQYAPTRGRYKVYLIDEVHMLSRSSFNALLKTLEEPPEHVKFILATTDPQKLPVTVLSRCLQFHLKALTVSQIEQQLKIILAAENVTYDAGSLTLLAKAARGSMRDSLSLTDQGIAQGKGTITVANIQQMLGGIDQNWVFKILISLIKQDAQQLMKLSLEIASYAPNYSRLMAELIQLLHQVAMAQVVERHFDLSPEHDLLLTKFSQAMSPEDVQLYYQIVLNGRKDLPYASDEQAAFDMVLLRLLAFKPIKNVLSTPTKAHEEVEATFDFEDLPDTQVNQSSLLNCTIEPVGNTSTDSVQPTDYLYEEIPYQENSYEESQSAQSIVEQQLSEQMADIENQAIAQATDNFQIREAEISEEQLATDNYLAIPQASDNSVSKADNSQQYNAAEKLQTDPTLFNPNLSISSAPQTALESVLATRNILRSRKKAMEGSGKKPSDAATRQHSIHDETTKSLVVSTKDKNSQPNVPDIETISEQAFSVDIIDPATIRSANQVDKWANMIDSMELGGRLRQLAIHATICDTSTDDILVLSLDQNSKHLKTDVAHQQLQTQLSKYLSRSITVEINIVEQTLADPFQIQTHINDKRYDYAKDLLKEDPLVKAFEKEFQAELDEKTIVAR